MYWDDLTRKAFEIASKAHMGQVDKAGAPYILHPLAVAKDMPTSEMAAAALLHDVCEDTPVTLDDLRAQGIPEIVAQAVKLLTREPGLSYMEYIERLKNDEISSAVKRADLRHNCSPNRKTSPPTKKDEERLRRYQKALDVLIAAYESEDMPTYVVNIYGKPLGPIAFSKAHGLVAKGLARRVCFDPIVILIYDESMLKEAK